MNDQLHSPPPYVAPSRGRGRLAVAVGLLAFLLGALLVGWLGWSGRLHSLRELAGGPPAPQVTASASPPALALPVAAPTAPAMTRAEGGFDQRLAALEQRLAQLDVRAEAASGNVARAEGLLIAFAARRAVERGTALGDLEDQLRLRFGEAQPRAVEAIVTATRQPVTVDALSAQLDALTPELSGATDSGWARFRREANALFTVRRDGRPSPRPADRLEHARQLLRGGQYDAAADEIARLPDAQAASGWVEATRRYAAAERALDLVETAALLDPAQLDRATGQLPARVPAAGR